MASWNANGLSNKVAQLSDFIDRYGINVMLVNETKFNRDSAFSVAGFTVVRRDRTVVGRGAGGVAIIIKDGIQFQELQNDNLIENVTLKIGNLKIVAAYRPPKVKVRADDFRRLLGNSGRTLIVGDLNAQHWSWNCTTANRTGHTLYDFVCDDRLNVHFPDTHTHYPSSGQTKSTIDIVINKNLLNITPITVVPDLDSDHNPIMFEIFGRVTIEPGKKIISFKDTNWSKFRSDLDLSVKLNDRICNEAELNREIENLVAAVQKATDRNSRKVDANLYRSGLPREIKDIMAERNRARRRWQTRGSPQYLHDLKRLTKEVRRAIREHKNITFNRRVRNLRAEDSTLWKVTRRYNKVRERIPALAGNGIVAHTSEEKANLLAASFQRVHDISNSSHDREHQEVVQAVEDFLEAHNPILNDEVKNSLISSPQEVKVIIKSLESGKSPGMDEIKNVVVRNLSPKAIRQLTNIINGMLVLQIFPTCWKSAVVVLVP